MSEMGPPSDTQIEKNLGTALEILFLEMWSSRILIFPKQSFWWGVLTGLQRATKGCRGHSSLILIRKNQYLVTLALVSPRRNRGSRAQTSIFTIENQHFLVQAATAAALPPPLAVAVAVAGCGIWSPWDWGRKTGFSNGLAHSRSKVSGSWAEIESVHINFSRSIFSFMSSNYESGWLGRFEV